MQLLNYIYNNVAFTSKDTKCSGECSSIKDAGLTLSCVTKGIKALCDLHSEPVVRSTSSMIWHHERFWMASLSLRSNSTCGLTNCTWKHLQLWTSHSLLSNPTVMCDEFITFMALDLKKGLPSLLYWMSVIKLQTMRMEVVCSFSMLVIASEVVCVKTWMSSKRYGLSQHVDLGGKSITKKLLVSNIDKSHLSSMVCSALGQHIMAIGVQGLVMCDYFFIFWILWFCCRLA